MTSQTLSSLANSGVLTFSDGYRTKRDELDATGIPILRVAELGDGILTPADGDRVHTSYRKKMGDKTSRAGDVLVSTKGTVGRVAKVPGGFPEHVYSPQLCYLRVLQPEVLHPAWLYYWARSTEFLGQVAMYSGQTDMAPYLSLRDLASIKIATPPIDEQRRIAGVLGALDDLIEVNRGLMADIEDLLAAQFAAFGFDRPGDSRLGDLILVNPLRSKPRGDAAYIDMAALSETQAGIDRVQRRPASGGARFVNGDALMARITPCLENGKIGFVDCLNDGEVGVGSTEFIVLRSEDPFPRAWSYLLARSPRFRDHVVRHMTGTSGRQRCPADAITEYSIAKPQTGDLASFAAAADPMFAAMKELRLENQDLIATRDELLPLLMSGRVRVGDVAA